MSADPTAGPIRPPGEESTASDPLKCDPDAGTVIAVNGGKSLPRVNRDYPIFTEWMLTEQEQMIAVDLRTCEVFGDPLLPDLIRVPGVGYALGYWDPWERRYATNPYHRFRLWKATPCDVIRWCNDGGYIYPSEFIAVPRSGPNGPARPPSGSEVNGERAGRQARRQARPTPPAGSADPLDVSAIADTLAECGHHLEAVFVRHFKGRQSTTSQDLVEAVCPGEERDWSTVKTWVNRVKNALHDADPRCRLTFHTSGRDHRVIKRVEPE
jgi:hypothetical protein